VYAELGRENQVNSCGEGSGNGSQKNGCNHLESSPDFPASPLMSGHGAAWLARLSGGQEVPSSNLGGPTIFRIDLPERECLTRIQIRILS
jgi:hypothetical protein